MSFKKKERKFWADINAEGSDIASVWENELEDHVIKYHSNSEHEFPNINLFDDTTKNWHPDHDQVKYLPAEQPTAVSINKLNSLNTI